MVIRNGTYTGLTKYCGYLSRNVTTVSTSRIFAVLAVHLYRSSWGRKAPQRTFLPFGKKSHSLRGSNCHHHKIKLYRDKSPFFLKKGYRVIFFPYVKMYQVKNHKNEKQFIQWLPRMLNDQFRSTEQKFNIYMIILPVILYQAIKILYLNKVQKFVYFPIRCNTLLYFVCTLVIDTIFVKICEKK